jgi:3-methylcrotonyl-CoA carboxylase alpha subunit
MLESILIANRGEIARRIIGTARRLGVRAIAVHSRVDRNAPFVREADETYEIGGAAPLESYLAATKILEAARSTGAAAIHPGYGFLSESAAFAAAVQAAGLVWVGAPPAAIRAMGVKDAAKALMIAAGVPVAPGYLGEDQTPAGLLIESEKIGYPIMVKAVAGGGGLGLRRVDTPVAFLDALAACRREAAAAFGDDRVLLERCVESPRHIEVQIFGDQYGEVVHLYERDCSIQRRHQKIIEEAPAPGMDAATRTAICTAAVRAAKAIHYVGAGTVEFIADASQGLRADRVWFMEMNTRLQVEHPVTEAITGQDLVEWQLRVASGEPLPLRQDQLRMGGWAMEARLYAENPATGFLPSTGRLRHLRLPADIRIDSGVEAGDEVSGCYDPLLAKLIVHAANRPAAARKLARACGQVEIWPVHSNAALLARIAADPDFVAGRVDTDFIEHKRDTLLVNQEPHEAIVQAAARALLPDLRLDPWSALVGLRCGAEPYREIAVELDGKTYRTTVDTAIFDGARTGAAARAPLHMRIDGDLVLFHRGAAWSCREPSVARVHGDAAHADGVLHAPMPGRIVGVAAKHGQTVTRGQRLIILEAMKMEHAMTAPFDGIVAELAVAEGDQVAEGVILVRIAREA